MIKRLRLPFVMIIGLFLVGIIITIVFCYAYNNTEWACKNIIMNKYQNDCLSNQLQYHQNNIFNASIIMISIGLGIPTILTFVFLNESKQKSKSEAKS